MATPKDPAANDASNAYIRRMAGRINDQGEAVPSLATPLDMNAWMRSAMAERGITIERSTRGGLL